MGSIRVPLRDLYKGLNLSYHNNKDSGSGCRFLDSTSRVQGLYGLGPFEGQRAHVPICFNRWP